MHSFSIIFFIDLGLLNVVIVVFGWASSAPPRRAVLHIDEFEWEMKTKTNTPDCIFMDINKTQFCLCRLIDTESESVLCMRDTLPNISFDRLVLYVLDAAVLKLRSFLPLLYGV